MNKLITLLLVLFPILALGDIDLFQTSTDPIGRYKDVGSGSLYKIEYLDMFGANRKYDGRAYVWSDSMDHYIFGTESENGITQLLAVMTDGWNISDVVLSVKTDQAGFGPCPSYHFVSLSCSDLATKLNNDEHFSGQTFEYISDTKVVDFWKDSYEKSIKMPPL